MKSRGKEYHWVVTICLRSRSWVCTRFIKAHYPEEALEKMKKNFAYKEFPELEGKHFECLRIRRRSLVVTKEK